MLIEGFFEALIGGYRRTLDIALRFRFITLLVFLATAGFTVYLYIIIPKGFFPAQDTGVVFGDHRRRAGHLVPADGGDPAEDRRHRLPPIRIPQAYGATVGAGVGGPDRQQRPDLYRAEAVG